MTETEEKKVMQPTSEHLATPQHAPESHDGGYEKEDVNGGRIIGSFIIGVCVIGFIMFLVSEYFIISKERQIFESALKPESNQLRELRQREDGALNAYKVLDEKKGVYQIPISEAMKRIADEAYRKKTAPPVEESADNSNAKDAKKDTKPVAKKTAEK